jgi:hypothetical protein
MQTTVKKANLFYLVFQLYDGARLEYNTTATRENYETHTDNRTPEGCKLQTELFIVDIQSSISTMNMKTWWTENPDAKYDTYGS